MKKLFLLLTAVSLASCSSDNDAPIPFIPTPSSTADTYVKGTLNTTAFDYSYYLNSITSPSSYDYSNGFYSDGFTRYYYYGAEFSPNDNPERSMSISFQNALTSDSESQETAQFYTAFSTVPTNYITSTQNNSYVKGIEIDYSPNDTSDYSTLAGSQSGSTFNVTSSTEGIEPGGTLKIKTIIGTFSCKLYNFLNPSDVINVSNGTFKIVLREYN